jgi:hypothetical protein
MMLRSKNTTRNTVIRKATSLMFGALQPFIEVQQITYAAFVAREVRSACSLATDLRIPNLLLLATLLLQDYKAKCSEIRALHPQLDALSDESLAIKIQQRFGSERVRLGIATKKGSKRGAF